MENHAQTQLQQNDASTPEASTNGGNGQKEASSRSISLMNVRLNQRFTDREIAAMKVPTIQREVSAFTELLEHEVPALPIDDDRLAKVKASVDEYGIDLSKDENFPTIAHNPQPWPQDPRAWNREQADEFVRRYPVDGKVGLRAMVSDVLAARLPQAVEQEQAAGQVAAA